MHGEIKNIQDLSINTICEINDFINSFNEIIDKVSNYIKVERFFVKLFKKANYFYFHLEHLKQVEKLNAKTLNVCVDNQLNNLQLIEIYFWAYNDFLKLKNCGQKSNLELTELCRKYELTLRKSIVSLLGEKPNQSLLQKISDYSVRQKSLFNSILYYRFSKLSFKSSNQLAAKIELSRQRTRQLRIILLNKLPVLFSFLSEIEISSINLYGIDFNCDYIVIQEGLVNEMNKNEGTNFNAQFVLKILSVIMQDRFVLIGDEKSLLFKMNSYGSFNWQSDY